ncbi:hypothetical protein PUV47_01705 [Pseudovibrio exalbescens]|uniref:hypothetical protein n=1 Tax=Pseudovibrio exalbescens TaxID=197461 RepID=UPI002366CFA2|nr:hypothetical protein [Pseudovibrio exalbescens]MDD7908618.1 hypothetical protein [Pseudovibrio exalbescens]
MRYPWAAAACLLATTVYAQPASLEPWQAKALATVLDYKRVETAQWNAPDQLMLKSSEAGIAWNTVLDQAFCKTSLSDLSKPEGHEFTITVFHSKTMQFLGAARCK